MTIDGINCEKCGVKLETRNTYRKPGRIERYRVCPTCKSSILTVEKPFHANAGNSPATSGSRLLRKLLSIDPQAFRTIAELGELTYGHHD